ncbi:hypothetical protein GCM10010862_26920 [Devosia nitrariae]|uniref:HNH endonuclease n=1 Tax=Devosia nitrariae TaxID=2071872 RepID=A0ABQ5W6L9_9HYPH|nr:hypothetical protein GCM10010862_26920 [Devosia nitrariae]
MPLKPKRHAPPGQATRAEQRKRYDHQRGKTAERGYGGRWQRERGMFLNQNPLCIKCQKEGRITAASVVDHIIPHQGDPLLMWDWSNWQAQSRGHAGIGPAAAHAVGEADRGLRPSDQPQPAGGHLFRLLTSETTGDHRGRRSVP